MWLFFIVCALAVAAIIIFVTAQIVQRRPSHREREAVAALRRCRAFANQYQETDAGLAYEILSVTTDLEKRELL